MSDTYLIVLTETEEPTLWLAQRDLRSLVSDLQSECGSHHKANVFSLTLSEVQLNNCFQGKLLSKVAQAGEAAFETHLRGLLRTAIRLEKRIPLLESAQEALNKEITTLKEKLNAKDKSLQSSPEDPHQGRDSEDKEARDQRP